MHQNKGKTIADCLGDRTDYAMNPDKTEGGELVTSYQCDPRTVQGEFLLSKRQYKTITGREHSGDVIAYQIRQSFKPDEVTAEEANQIGYELGLVFTKGNHSFIVATHTDKSHIHSHIIFNSTSLDCKKKFRNFLGSGKALGRLSDRICLEHGLSIIENPKRSKGHYGKWLGDKKPLSHSEKLRQTIDEILTKKPTDFATFLQAMETAGYAIKQGKYLAFKSEEQQKFIRLRSLGEGYSEDEIRDAIAGKSARPERKSAKKPPEKSFNLIIDIQAKMAQGKTAGYEQWAKKFNVKQMSKTLNYLTENKLLRYADLEAKATQATETYDGLMAEIKSAEKRMAEIQVLRTHIVNYAKTREVYTAYRKAGYSKKFFEEHRADLTIHKAAKAYFSSLETKKLPTMKELNGEYATLLTTKKEAYKTYRDAKTEMQEVLTAKANIDSFMGYDPKKTEQEKSQGR
ncbi:relaxase/mobilization nuclease domain-containing protein [Bengtsoniella intestinalis]